MKKPVLSMEENVIQVLVVRAQEGDTEAFAKLYDHFFPPIYRYAAFRAPQEMVEDLVADVFVKSWEKLHTYKVRRGVPFGAWLFRIARYTIIDAYRTQRDFDEVPEEFADTDILNYADTSLHRKDLLRIVRTALAALPRKYRDVLLLSYVAELPSSEVARVLRITNGSMRVLKMRALRKLEALLPTEMVNRV